MIQPRLGGQPTAHAPWPQSPVDNPAPTSVATGVQTTAEAIAAELAAAESAKPKVVLTTFSPDNLLPGMGLQQRRRLPGASPIQVVRYEQKTWLLIFSG